MILKRLTLLNFKNIADANLEMADKLNCLVGLNGQGKTNVLDAIYMLSFTKSAFTSQDSTCIRHGEQMGMVCGEFADERMEQIADSEEGIMVSCGLKSGVKKQFRWGKKDYKRLTDHIGRIPLVMVCPEDEELIKDGSDYRRKFLDGVISQYDPIYLERLTRYNALLKQRNALLKQLGEDDNVNVNANGSGNLLEILELQMVPEAEYIYRARTEFIEQFIPIFQQVYTEISGGNESVKLTYRSQLQDRDLQESYVKTRQRDLILGWTSQGIHKDDIEMQLGEYAIKQVGSQGQQKTFVLSMKLAQALYLSNRSQRKPILLLDDIFDKLDSERVERIVRLVCSDSFGQIFITDTDRQHLTEILRPDESVRIFHVESGVIA